MEFYGQDLISSLQIKLITILDTLLVELLLIGFALIAFSVVDRIRARVLTHMFKRDVYIRILTIIAIAIIVAGVVSVNNSIADAKKIEFLGTLYCTTNWCKSTI